MRISSIQLPKVGPLPLPWPSSRVAADMYEGEVIVDMMLAAWHVSLTRNQSYLGNGSSCMMTVVFNTEQALCSSETQPFLHLEISTCVACDNSS